MKQIPPLLPDPQAPKTFQDGYIHPALLNTIPNNQEKTPENAFLIRHPDGGNFERHIIFFEDEASEEMTAKAEQDYEDTISKWQPKPRYKGCFLIVMDQSPLSGAAAHYAYRTNYNLLDHLREQKGWSEKTFGPHDRTDGIIDHIQKELAEVKQAQQKIINATSDAEREAARIEKLTEWLDIVNLGFDGAWRDGFSPAEIVDAFIAKFEKNKARDWPDWRTQPADKAIEHKRKPEA